MSDDLVKRLRQSWDADRSIMSQTGRWMAEREEAADRIEELEAKLSESEALLAKAVEALSAIEGWSNNPEIEEFASTTLAELTGGKDAKN